MYSLHYQNCELDLKIQEVLQEAYMKHRCAFNTAETEEGATAPEQASQVTDHITKP